MKGERDVETYWQLHVPAPNMLDPRARPLPLHGDILMRELARARVPLSRDLPLRAPVLAIPQGT